MFNKGDDVEAIVLDIDVDNERLSLGVKQLEDDPWETIAQRYPVGSKISGSVSSVTDFGVFVEIEQGIEGLIHNSQLGLKKDDDAEAAYPLGSKIDSEVVNVDREERRISLSIKSIKSRAEKEEMAEFMQDSNDAVTFGDLLRQKMDTSDE
jgi:small subunit ribosomal protein S1